MVPSVDVGVRASLQSDHVVNIQKILSRESLFLFPHECPLSEQSARN